jgi:hypothetical protein
VFDGRAVQGQSPPLVVCWHLGPERVGEGLASENWGLAHQRWQITPHGLTQGQARYLAEQITEWEWPVGWEFIEFGPMAADSVDKPDSWSYPLIFVCRDMGGQATTGSGFDAGFDTGF